MPSVQRSSDIIEAIAERAISFAFGGIVLALFGWLLFHFRGEGMFVPLSEILLLFGILMIGTAIYSAFQVRKVTSFAVACPFCATKNNLTESPEVDFPCVSCHRMVPILEGEVMAVSQVQCGFCKQLNYYCDKTEILICENCDHEIPIAQEEGKVLKTLPKGFAIVDDDSLYELVLSDAGHKHEEIITTLQQMLALNRNQVKEMLENLPVTLLTGINRRKAEMLQAQIGLHGATADIQVLTV